jgi:hypothetical protein
MKCYLCKEIGHKASECERDPNLRTTFDVQEESVRLVKLSKTSLKQFADQS